MSKEIYARGFFDGLKAAGFEGEVMNAGRAESLIKGLTAVAKQVYEATPIQSDWSFQQVAAELARNGRRHDLKLIGGCLDSLKSQGLVKEVEKGMFRRVDFQKTKVTIKPIKPVFQQEFTVNEEMPKSTTRTALDILADVERQADKVMTECANLKQLIAKAAIEIEEQVQASEDKTEQLSQLKKLLKSIAD